MFIHPIYNSWQMVILNSQSFLPYLQCCLKKKKNSPNASISSQGQARNGSMGRFTSDHFRPESLKSCWWSHSLCG